jgi:lambda family phage portal protein
MLDPDQLDHKLNREAAPGRNAIVMGVEIDPWGGPVAYYLHANHPSETSRTHRHVVVPADDMIHLFAAMRPKQVRGLTWFAPVVLDLRMLAGYREAELVAARAGASKVGFLKMTDPDARPLEEDESDDAEDLAGRRQVVWEAEPGTIEQLPFGTEFQGWDPQHPNSGFDAFDKAILRGVAAATRISYMSLTGDLNGTTYGSGRMGMLAERQVFQKLQQRLVAHVHDRVYDRWLPEALISGQLALDSFNVDRYRARAWHPRPFPWIDPVKDIDAAAREVRMGINTLTRITAERGRDFAEMVRERAHEIALMEAAGVPSDLTSNGQPQQAEDESAPARTNNDRTTDRDARAVRPRKLIGGR